MHRKLYPSKKNFSQMLITGGVDKKYEDQKHRKQALNGCSEAMIQSKGPVGLEVMRKPEPA